MHGGLGAGEEWDEDCDEDMERPKLRPELKELAKQRDVIVAGRGFNALDDRIYVRDELLKRLMDEMGCAAMEFCYVYCPSELLEHGLELVDTPGADDADAVKVSVLARELENASNVLCVHQRKFEQEKALRKVLTDHGVFGKVFESVSDSEKEFHLILLSNLEKEWGMTAHNWHLALERYSSGERADGAKFLLTGKCCALLQF